MNDKPRKFPSPAALRPAARVSYLFLLAIAAGCGGGGHERYVPPAEKARAAVEAVLSAWKAGEPHLTVTSLDTPIDLYDARRQAGQKLEDFRILEEIAGGEHPAFRASLRFAGKPKQEETTYLVIGINPLNVFRTEDYKRATGM